MIALEGVRARGTSDVTAGLGTHTTCIEFDLQFRNPGSRAAFRLKFGACLSHEALWCHGKTLDP